MVYYLVDKGAEGGHGTRPDRARSGAAWVVATSASGLTAPTFLRRKGADVPGGLAGLGFGRARFRAGLGFGPA